MAPAQCTPSQGKQQFRAVARAGEHDEPLDPREFGASAVVEHSGQIPLGDQPSLAVGDQEQLVVRSILRVFADELDVHVTGGRPYEGVVEVPKLVDIRDGVALYDERQGRKQPDWTYAQP